MAIRLATICSLLLGVRTCSVTGDWKQTSAVTQRAAAQVVIQGVADGIFSCILDPALPDYDADSPKTSYHAKDEELLNQSGLCTESWDSVVLVRNITVLKGSISCDEVLVGGFSSSAACGTDPPSFGVSGTYFLCGVETNGCKATLNTNGDIHLGFTEEAVGEATQDCSENATCVDVKLCESLSTSWGFLLVPTWTMLVLLLNMDI